MTTTWYTQQLAGGNYESPRNQNTGEMNTSVNDSVCRTLVSETRDLNFLGTSIHANNNLFLKEHNSSNIQWLSKNSVYNFCCFWMIIWRYLTKIASNQIMDPMCSPVIFSVFSISHLSNMLNEWQQVDVAMSLIKSRLVVFGLA